MILMEEHDKIILLMSNGQQHVMVLSNVYTDMLQSNCISTLLCYHGNIAISITCIATSIHMQLVAKLILPLI